MGKKSILSFGKLIKIEEIFREQYKQVPVRIMNYSERKTFHTFFFVLLLMNGEISFHAVMNMEGTWTMNNLANLSG